MSSTDSVANRSAIDAWPDARLIAAVRLDPPDAEALEELARRHWKALLGQCHAITSNRVDAADLAQEAWFRVLRSRQHLKPEGNFPGYLRIIATNLWRDRRRFEYRAGTLAPCRVISLDQTIADHDGDAIQLGEVLADVSLLEAQQQSWLMTDINQALGRLPPLVREVLVARFLSGESCAVIGQRHGRTEQTVSSWVRRGIQEMKKYLLEANCGLQLKEPSPI